MTKFKKFRRILAGVLCCAMAFSCMSVAAFAKVNADGSRSLCSIDQPEQEIVADTVKEPSPAAQLFL